MLHYYEKEKLGFFHIPKTAGRSTMRAFGKIYGSSKSIYSVHGRHEPLVVVKELMGPEFDSTRLVTVIRNPYDLAVSHYFWIRRDPSLKDKQSKINIELLKIYDLTFSQYIDWHCENWNSYKDWLFIDDKYPNIQILRFENLQNDINNFVGETVELEHLNRAPRRKKGYKPYFNKKLYTKITNKYKWCFDQGFYIPE